MGAIPRTFLPFLGAIPRIKGPELGGDSAWIITNIPKLW
jgi:hypothetical protein